MNLFVIPFMSAILGWLVAWLFIKAIFLSWKGGLKNVIQSVQIGSMLPNDVANAQCDSLLPLIDTQFDQFFKHKLGEKMPMISMFIGDKTVTQLKGIFIEELQLIFPTILNQFFENAKQDFTNNIETKWRAILEPILLKATRKFRIIAFLIGLFWGIITLMLTHLL
jgi:hypothetical protein